MQAPGFARDLRSAPMELAPAEFSRLIVDETEKSAKMIHKCSSDHDHLSGIRATDTDLAS